MNDINEAELNLKPLSAGVRSLVPTSEDSRRIAHTMEMELQLQRALADAEFERSFVDGSEATVTFDTARGRREVTYVLFCERSNGAWQIFVAPITVVRPDKTLLHDDLKVRLVTSGPEVRKVFANPDVLHGFVEEVLLEALERLEQGRTPAGVS